jgi:hypothetical protein
MKRYYICPKSVWEEPTDVLGATLPRHQLLPGSHWVQLDDDHILICTGDFDSEWAQEQWHCHPDVARLAHPSLEAKVPIYQLCEDPSYAHKQFTDDHWALLVSAFALDETHTVWDLHSKLKDSYPALKLSTSY